MDNKLRDLMEMAAGLEAIPQQFALLYAGLMEAIADLDFIRNAAKEADIAALAEAASAVATCYLKQAKGSV